MAYQITTATRKIAGLTKRLRFVQGGTSASKTVSIVLFLINLAQSDRKPTLTSIMSESLPHLKRGAMRDFLLIMQEHKYFKDDRWNKSDFTYTFETGSKIEFFSIDQADKVRGARRDRGFLNECNNNTFAVFEQLEVRTKEFFICDWNPSSEFWFNDEIEGKRTDYEHLIITYKDNEALSPEIIASIEQRRNRKGWWQVYGLGLLGEVEGKIYRDWETIDEVPHVARLERRGLDFGYTNDPTAIVDIYRFNGGFVLDEKLYQTAMTNREIGNFVKELPNVLMIADSAEPKSIDELKLMGIQVLPATKGQGSVNQGIQYVQDQRIYVTRGSTNLIREYRNYLWKVDKDGKVLNVPEGGLDHALDAVRYAISSLVGQRPGDDAFAMRIARNRMENSGSMK